MRRTPAVATLAAMAALGAGLVTGCGGHGSSSLRRHPVDLQAFLRLPVATPSVCGGTISGSTAGRRPPWVGNVDVSVFLEPSATATQITSLGHTLDGLPEVQRAYYETAEQAYAEFQRLYTCSADVPRSAVPASYRLVLKSVTRPQRDDLVSRVRGLPGVKSVSCDPSSPCLN